MKNHDAQRPLIREQELADALEAHVRYAEGAELTRAERKSLQKWTGEVEFEELKKVALAARRAKSDGIVLPDPKRYAEMKRDLLAEYRRQTRMRRKLLEAFREQVRRTPWAPQADRIAASPQPAGADSELAQSSYSQRGLATAEDTGVPMIGRPVGAVDTPSSAARSESVILYMEVLDGDEEPREIQARLYDAVFGRARAALKLEGDPQISRRHARVLLLDGEVVVTDLDSQNGTYVNGARITEPTGVEVGAIIEIGRARLTLDQVESEGRGYARAVFSSEQGDRYSVDLSEMVLGRGRRAAIVLEDESHRLSRRHARLDLCDGQAYVTDLESTNGVLVNERRIDGSMALEPETLLQVGGVKLRIIGMVRR